MALMIAAPATVLAAGKIEHEYKPQKPDGSSARDASTGLPTGKRMHKPFSAKIGPDHIVHKHIGGVKYEDAHGSSSNLLPPKGGLLNDSGVVGGATSARGTVRGQHLPDVKLQVR
jgi:hypothetical protein